MHKYIHENMIIKTLTGYFSVLVYFLPYTFIYLNFYNKQSLYTSKGWLFILKRMLPIAMGFKLSQKHIMPCRL